MGNFAKTFPKKFTQKKPSVVMLIIKHKWHFKKPPNDFIWPFTMYLFTFNGHNDLNTCQAIKIFVHVSNIEWSKLSFKYSISKKIHMYLLMVHSIMYQHWSFLGGNDSLVNIHWIFINNRFNIPWTHFFFSFQG